MTKYVTKGTLISAGLIALTLFVYNKYIGTEVEKYAAKF